VVELDNARRLILESIAERRQRLMGAATIFYQDPVQIVRGEGVYLYDDKGREYIDLYNNVPCVGHANPVVANAIAKQMSTLQVHSRYLHDGILDYAERLVSLHHGGMQSAVFACSGTEAAEISLLMARAVTNGQGIICSDATYHGNSTEVRKLTRAAAAGGSTDPQIKAVPFAQTYRPLVEGCDDVTLCEHYLDKIREAIADFDRKGIPFAGMIVCSIFANEGLPDIPAGYLNKATDIVHAAGGLMIADEVQAGFCRSGDWWGYETSDFIPDIALMGKPMGNGFPLSCVVSSQANVAAFRESTRYFNTFASSPVQAAAGMAVLDEIEQRQLLEQSRSTGAYMLTELKNMQTEPMGDIRGCGLFIGIDWVSDRETRTPDMAGAVQVANRMKDAGFLLSNAGANGNVIKIRPPLVFEKRHADLFLAAFKEVTSE
jgi:4-aminobutyrate aminotransferase-like enzyme